MFFSYGRVKKEEGIKPTYRQVTSPQSSCINVLKAKETQKKHYMKLKSEPNQSRVTNCT